MNTVPFDRVHIIVNPNSNGGAEKSAMALKDALAPRLSNIPITLYRTKYAGHARELAAGCALEGERPLLISASGDGGYNEVINGIVEAGNRNAVSTVLPAGNANDHYRLMARQPIFDAVLAGATRDIDLLKMTMETRGHTTMTWAHSYIGLGLTPAMARGFEHGNKGRIREVFSAVRTFVTLEPFFIETAHGQRRLDSLIFANIGGMAKYAKLSRRGAPDDGVFEVLLLPHWPKYRLALRALKAATVGLSDGFQTDTYSFVTNHRLDIQIDGDLKAVPSQSTIVVDVAHRAITIL